jgi:ATP-dependent protease ClpP protease subunit
VTIGLFGDVGYEITAEDVAVAVAAAKGKPLNVNIFSFGGDALQGLAINQILSAHDAEVTTNVLGVAASAGSVIAMAGKYRKVAVNAALMIHNPWSITVGDASEHRKSANMLDGLEAAYLYTYSNATGIPATEIQPYLKEERWLYGEEAMALGFATEAPEPIKAFASIKPPPADRFRQIPDDLKAMAGISAEVSAEITHPNDPPEDPELKVSGPPDAVLELMAQTADPAPSTMTNLNTEQPTPQTAALPMTVQTPDLEATRLEERDRVRAIRGMAQMHNLSGDLVDHLINNGVAVADAREQVLAKIATRHEATVGAIADAGGVPLCRVPEGTHFYIKRALDAGAWGIVVPMVNTVEQAKAAIAAAKYPPLGNRSVGGGMHALNWDATAMKVV